MTNSLNGQQNIFMMKENTKVDLELGHERGWDTNGGKWMQSIFPCEKGVCENFKKIFVQLTSSTPT